MQEKRRFPRHAVQLQVSVDAHDGAEPLEANARNLSIGGIFVMAKAPLAFGQKVTLSLSLPGVEGGPWRLPAVVRWNGAEGFGLQFGLLGAKETHALAQFLRP